MGEIFSKFWMFQTGSVVVFYQVKGFCCVTSNVTLSISESTRGFSRPQLKTSKDIPFVFWTAQYLFSIKFGFLFLRQKHLRVFICSQWSCQVQLPWGALWYSVIACVQLAVSIGLLRGPLRCSGKKRSTASTVVQVELEDVVFVRSSSGKRVLPVLPRAYSEWHRLMLHEKNAHVTPWFGWSYCSNVFLMLVPSFAVSAREFNGVVAASELLLLDFARKPVVPLAMDLVETRPTSSRVDT